jgi:formyl-CoA transferase/CoA:oxalate CoA-transferase
VQGESAYFLSVNRNKRSVEIDIKDPDDAAVLQRLLARSDVFITNVPRMTSLQRAGIDPETVRALNPRLIYAAISGYGHSGIKASRSGYDIIAQGEAGLMALTGEVDGGPIRFPTPMADITAGLYTAIGITTALYERDRPGVGSGEGQFIDVALVDAQTTWLANIGGSFFVTGERPKRLGNIHPTITPYQPVRARDKMMIIAVGTQRLWERFCEVLGVGDRFLSDPRYATNPSRNAHREELIVQIEEVLMRRDANDWVEALVAKGIPAGPINFPDETLTDAHIQSRDMIVELDHPAVGLVKSIGNPIHLSRTGPTYRRYPPVLGEHNDEIRRLAAAEDSD